jgi:ATP-dependent DNA helicase RecG
LELTTHSNFVNVTRIISSIEKDLISSPAKLLKHIAAFANADGGELVVGIDDEKTGTVGTQRWNGAANIEEFNGFMQAIRQIDPPCNVTAAFLVCAGLPGYALHLDVEKDSFVHTTPDGKVYQRVSAASLPLLPQQVVDLAYAKGERSFEDAKVTGVRMEDIVDSKELRTFLTDYSPQTDPLDFTVNQYLVDVRTWEPTVAGLLLFANNPSAVVPK